jgi:hypothetical protein
MWTIILASVACSSMQVECDKAYRAAGWAAWQRKDYVEAERYLVKAIKLGAGGAETSSWLGTVIVLQKNPKRQHDVLWQFARAAYLEGPGDVDPELKPKVVNYFERFLSAMLEESPWTREQIIETAMVMPFPDPKFRFDQHRGLPPREATFERQDPGRYIFLGIKKALLASDGDEYWGRIKNFEMPTFKGRLLVARPKKNPKEIVLAVESENVPDVTLLLKKPLRGKAPVGTLIEFIGTSRAFTKEPFSMTLDVETEKVKGWPAQR